MSINISDKPEMNVVNVGDEISTDQLAAIQNAASATAVNPFLTASAGNTNYLQKSGGGTVVGTVVVDTDGTVGGDTTTVTGTSVEVSNFGVGTIKMDPVLGVTFPDGSSQGTAAQAFNQSLNITDNVEFANVVTPGYVAVTGPSAPASVLDVNGLTLGVDATGVTFPDSTTQTTAFKTDWTGSYQFADAGFGSIGAYTYINGSGIQFPDLTTQTTAAKNVDIQTFGSSTTSGTFTWTKPAGARFVRAYVIGGGGGGASGARRDTAVARAGGSGGIGGSYATFDIPAELLGPTVTVVVGAGGAARPGKTTDNSFGDSGNSPTESKFGDYRAGTAAAATAGQDVQNAAQIGGMYISGILQAASISAGRGNITTGTASTSSTVPFTCFGGGGGGGQGAGLTSSTAGGGGGAKIVSAGSNSGTTVGIAGGVAGTGTANGGPGVDSTIFGLGGTGGGGGGHNFSGAATDGGDGGWPGGGGGGGGASDNGFTSGAGGKGGNGAVFVVTYF